jgi:hypothetical protein
MAYDLKSQFEGEFKATHSGDSNVETAWKVYNNARNNPNHFCLMGRLSDRDAILGTDEVKDGSVILLGNDGVANFLVTNKTQPGNVLKIGTWSLGINDAWVLGGTHGNGSISSTFNFFGENEFKKEEIDKFVDTVLRSAKYGTTVTAREILGLIAAGYKVCTAHGALIFKPTGATAKSDLTFEQYVNSARNFTRDTLISLITSRLNSAEVS